MKRNCREVIESLLSVQPFIRSREVWSLCGISPQAAWKQLRRMVCTGELAVEGVGRGVRYRLPTSFREDPRRSYFWNDLMSACPAVKYLRLVPAGSETFRTREQARKLLIGVPFANFIVLDLAEVVTMGDAFARELFCPEVIASGRVQAINATPVVSAVITSAQRWHRLAPI